MTALFEGGSCRDCACDVQVSVVTPLYNAGPWLDEQLRSLAAQDTPLVWELVLSDNGSTDDFLALVRQHADAFHSVRVVDASDRRGPAHARNAGVRAARGRVLLFCDADDVVHPLWVHQMHRAAAAGRLLGGRLDYALLNPEELQSSRQHLQAEELHEFYGRAYVVSANLGICRDDFATLGGFDESFAGAAGEDVDLSLRALEDGLSLTFVEAAVVHYRLRQEPAAAITQARGYGRSSAVLCRRHRGLIVTPTLWHELLTLGFLLLRLSLERTAATDGSQTRWRLAYHGEFAKAMLLWPPYYRVPVALPTERRVPTLRRTRRRLRDAAVAALHARVPELRPPPPRPADPWAYEAEIRQSLPPAERRMLGAGLLADADVTLEVTRGQDTYLLNPALDAIVSGVVERGGYSLDEVDRLHAFLRARGSGQRDLVVNVGANVGTTAIPFARLGWRVLAIEPVPRAAELLRRAVAANGLVDRVTVVECAITAAPGPVEMVAGANLSTSEVRGALTVSDLATPGDHVARVITVPGRRLDEVLREHGVEPSAVALVWSDTEGSESHVIRTGEALWAHRVPLWVEIRPSALVDHGRLTDFCALVTAHFATFSSSPEAGGGGASPTDEFRGFVDAVGQGRWDFQSVLLLS